MFVDDNVVGLGPELVHDIRVPGVADQNSTFSTVGGMNGLPDAERQVPQAVWRIGSAQVGEIRTKSHFERHNLYARPASRYQCSCYRADGLLNTRNIKSVQVEHPALGAKIVWVWLLFGNGKSREKSGDCGRCRRGDGRKLPGYRGEGGISPGLALPFLVFSAGSRWRWAFCETPCIC